MQFAQQFMKSMIVVVLLLPSLARAQAPTAPDMRVRCANLIYGNGKSSVCFSSEFLSQVNRESNIQTDPELYPVKLESPDLYQFPFCVMTGEGGFQLTELQRDSLRNYLTHGGFIIASAGCSNRDWAASFRSELSRVFPDVMLTQLDISHPIFHTLYDIPNLDLGKSRGQAHLEGLELDGKIVLVFSSDGLNDSGKVSDDCCCCGGNEVKNARLVNCNLLTYTLTH
ncbi:MAG: DUF4159 domain-containing protein [Planctomycetales bacterium]|nr:DUF4159 domain-containing protein [Planctomycetales bacterium]MCA9167926.1 DUF4159 domain-containing protein [Planctomycetales bacterium]